MSSRFPGAPFVFLAAGLCGCAGSTPPDSVASGGKAGITPAERFQAERAGGADGQAKAAPPFEAPSRPAAPPAAARPGDGSPAGAQTTGPPSRPAPKVSRIDRAPVGEFLTRLQASQEAAELAFRELWEVESSLIPDLILEVENTAPSQLRELKIFVADKEEFARRNVLLDEKEERLLYVIPGMGSLQYDSIATGPVRGGKSLKVVVKRFESAAPFTVGTVIRAALLNRFRSGDHPPGAERANIVAWWQEYYDRVRSEL